MKKVLVGSPVYQKPEILEAFLDSLKRLNGHTVTMDYMFVNDNSDERSSQLLLDFERTGSSVKVIQGQVNSCYVCDDESHHWDDHLMLKVANYKNSIIEHAIEQNYDYLFFVDSDLILHPNLIEHLKTADQDIVSEIFWSQWHPRQRFEPNVWLFDEYDLVPKKLGEEVKEEEKAVREIKFLNKLKRPGLYEVGGLGACTLIKKEALLSGVNFSPISNLTLHGEDRFFCIRAAVLGLGLFVDTHYPAYHIYRETDLEGVQDYVKASEADANFVRTVKPKGNRITLSMVVKNEERRYLRRVLTSLKHHVDEAVIIDDGSSDQTVEMCRAILCDIPLHVVQNEASLFDNEVNLRKLQWEETAKTKPDWILNLDADELIEEEFWKDAQDLIDDPQADLYSFRLFDMWNSTHYREDSQWQAHHHQMPVLMRYQPQFNYQWHEMAQHCGRFPMNTFKFTKVETNFRIQHLGWAKHEDRVNKFKRYQLLDPDSVYGIQAQYDSILDREPNLIMWEVSELS